MAEISFKSFSPLLFGAMVSYAGLPQYFIDILEDHCPFVRDPIYLHPDGCHYRDKDFYEMYSGVGHLWQAVCLDSCVGNACFAVVSRQCRCVV